MANLKLVRSCVASCCALAVMAAAVPSALAEKLDEKFKPQVDMTGWPAEVKGVVPPKPGEHPRLLFRKTDVAKLREKAKTPEGQAIIARLKKQLDGANGDTFPKLQSVSAKAYDNKGVKKVDDGDLGGDSPAGGVAYTYSHAAGYGLLYQLTGDRKYADLGRQAFETAWKGVRDRDDRYSWRSPGGALRAGPSMGWYALGYDLCYDGWDADFRQLAAKEISAYPGEGTAAGSNDRIERCILGLRQHPPSNHWGMQVGGASMALQAIWGDPGADMEKFDGMLEKSQRMMIVNLTQGFGDGGFFGEGDGTGSMSSHIAFLPALQAWKTGYGKDFMSPRPNGYWAAYRWFLQTVSDNGKPSYQPQRGGYPHNIWSRTGVSGAGYFSIGFGVAPSDDVKSALLWYYNHGGFKAADAKNGTPYDTTTPYPHHSVLSFVNWPVGLPEKNPKGIIPNAAYDSKFGFYLWRDKWEDNTDVVVSILSKGARGNMSVPAEKTLSIAQGGKVSKWGNFAGGFKGEFKPDRNGSTVLETGDGSFAIDLSNASGNSAVLICTGGAAGPGESVDAGGTKVTFAFIGKGEKPTPTAAGNKITIGGQTVSIDGGKIALAK